MKTAHCAAAICGATGVEQSITQQSAPIRVPWVYLGAMAASSASAGLGFVASKGVIAHIPPLPLLTVQLAASVLIFWSIVLIRGLRAPFRRETLLLALTGLLAPGLANTLALFGLRFTTVSVASLLWAAEPIFIMGLAWVLLRERIGGRLVAFSLLAILGAMLVVSSDGSVFQQSFQLGAAITMAGVFSCSLYTVFSRNAAARYDPMLIVALQQTVGLIWVAALLPIEGLGGGFAGLDQVRPSVWAWAVGAGVVQYAMGYGFYVFGLKKTPASLAALFLTLIPVFSLSGAYIFLGERLNTWQWVGGLLTLGAVLFVLRRQGSREETGGVPEPAVPVTASSLGID